MSNDYILWGQRTHHQCLIEIQSNSSSHRGQTRQRMDPWGRETTLKVDGAHIQVGLGWNKSLEGSHIPDIHVNPHEVVLGVEVHVWLEAVPLADIVATHSKHWAPDGEVFTDTPDHLVSFYLLCSYNDQLVFLLFLMMITLSLSSFFSSITVLSSRKEVGRRVLILSSKWNI